MRTLRWLIVLCFAALVPLGLAWELWLAPLRPHGSLLALKVLPLCAALAPLARGHIRTFQWWSMLILAYLTEGLVRATSDHGSSATLAWIETALSALAFGLILAYMSRLRKLTRPAASPPGGPAARGADPSSPAPPLHR